MEHRVWAGLPASLPWIHHLLSCVTLGTSLYLSVPQFLTFDQCPCRKRYFSVGYDCSLKSGRRCAFAYSNAWIAFAVCNLSHPLV